MRNTLAIARRELGSFFASPLGYVIAGLFLLITGIFFYMIVRFYALDSMQAGMNPMLAERLDIHEGVVRPFYQNLGFIFLLVVPLLSMRLLSEEKKQGTAELLLTAPIRTHEIVLGKYAGALAFLLVLLVLTFQYPIFLSLSGATPPVGPLLSAFLGVLLLGAAFLSVGLFMSSLTENQIVAAICSFLVLLVFWMAGIVGQLAAGAAEGVFRSISLIENAEDFSKGIIDTRHVVFFASFIAFNLFLTQRSVDSRRWR